MNSMKLFIYLLLTILYSRQGVLCFQDDWNCSIVEDEAIKLFKNKILMNQYPDFNVNPYTNQTDASLLAINETLMNNEIVCALQYDSQERISYRLKNFQSAYEAQRNGYIVTHQGICGACSTLNDLAVYLSGGLTSPTRKCGFIGILSESKAKQCLIEIGFSSHCADIWLFNTINTRKQCFFVCMVAWITNEPNNKPDGSLNDCLQCDEDKSGMIFKYYSGRTRRNSGIRSEIDRPTDAIYNITHCYY